MRLINVDDGVTDYQGWSPSLSLGRLSSLVEVIS